MCIYVYTHIFFYVYGYNHRVFAWDSTHIYLHVYRYIYTQIYMCICIYIWFSRGTVHKYVYLYIFMYTHFYLNICIYIGSSRETVHTYISVYMYIYTYIYTYMCIHIGCMRGTVHTYVHMYTCKHITEWEKLERKLKKLILMAVEQEIPVSLLQNIVSFIVLFCKRDLSFFAKNIHKCTRVYTCVYVYTFLYIYRARRTWAQAQEVGRHK